MHQDENSDVVFRLVDPVPKTTKGMVESDRRQADNPRREIGDSQALDLGLNSEMKQYAEELLKQLGRE